MDTKTVNYHGSIIDTKLRPIIKAIIIERDGSMCHKCLILPASEIHHLRYTEHPTVKDLVMLCHDCHIDITVEARGYKRRKGMTPTQARAAQRKEARLMA